MKIGYLSPIAEHQTPGTESKSGLKLKLHGRRQLVFLFPVPKLWMEICQRTALKSIRDFCISDQLTKASLVASMQSIKCKTDKRETPSFVFVFCFFEQRHMEKNATHQLNIMDAISHLTCMWSDPDRFSSVEEENASSTQETQI